MLIINNQRSILLQSGDSLSRGYPSLDLDTVYEEKSDTHCSSQSESPVQSRAPSPELAGLLAPARTNTITGTIASPAYGAFGKDPGRYGAGAGAREAEAVPQHQTQASGSVAQRDKPDASSGVTIGTTTATTATTSASNSSYGVSMDETGRQTGSRRGTSRSSSTKAASGSRKKPPKVQRQREVCDGIRAPLWATLTHAQTISDYDI
ncbi:hypothetical protein ZHAS_00008037 [Anopheles sinensis]|uniref:Uncharacterized protein n=1 Tax=Anopheles sinensis TaxID=74873 RepID=A0A084VRA4_ANOSI|nr:hypothetical protein ZHAS_00008037 [Anopheles sinensis]